MATTDPLISDPLLSLRRALAPSSSPPVLVTSSELSAENKTDDLSEATHLFVTQPIPQTFPLSTATRFVSAAADQRIDLRSIFFAWLKKDVAIPEYIASAQELNEQLKEKTGAGEGEGEGESPPKVLNLVFVERLDLITWLEGASEESEYIEPLEGAAEGAAAATGVSAGGAAEAAQASVAAPGAAGAAQDVSSARAKDGVPTAAAQTGARPAKVIDPRLQKIYNGERKMGDRNSVLRGIKPTEFSHVRKTVEMFLGRNRPQAGATKPGMKPSAPAAGSGAIPKRASESSSSRPNPIILVSPSASSLLRMSNIKTFLSDGVYIPPDHPTLSKATGSNILHVPRTLRTISGSSSQSSAAIGSGGRSAAPSPTTFILVDSTADFKPDYWNRVVAVFTTGQTWQFKSYKWSSPPELFKHAMGLYVGWRGENVPKEVKGWGRGVRSFEIDRWDEKAANINGAGGGAPGGSGRWRDRGVVEAIWAAIEEGMKTGGWGNSR